MSTRTLKNINYFKRYLKFKKTLKIRLFFVITSSKFNETTSFWTHFKENFGGIQFIKRTNSITHRIEIKIIQAIIEKHKNTPAKKITTKHFFYILGYFLKIILFCL